MKKLHLFLDAGGVILDESEHEQKRAELTVQLLTKNHIEYTIKKYWKDVSEAVELFIPRVYNYIFWVNTQNRELYALLLNEYKNN